MPRQRTTTTPAATLDEVRAALAGPKRSKYGNQRVTGDGYTFDSEAERRRYVVLRERQRLGEIADLEVHPAFRFVVNGVEVGRYTSDFAYRVVATGERVTEDVKVQSTMTQAYRIRKRLMLACFGIEVREVLG